MPRSSGSGTIGSNSPSNQNTLDLNDEKQSLDFYHTIIDWKQNTDVIPPSDSKSDNDNNDYSYDGGADTVVVSSVSGWFNAQ